MKSKYIIVEHMGLELPIVFNPILEHAMVAKDLKVISAGFCSFDPHEGFCDQVWGESISLKIKSRPRDGLIIMNSLEFDC